MANYRKKEDVRRIEPIGEYDGGVASVPNPNPVPNPTDTNNTSNVTYEKGKITAYLWIAPLGTPEPTSYGSELNPAYKLAGFVGEDGIEFAPETSVEDQKDMNGTVVLSEKTEDKKTMKLTLIEAKRLQAQKEYYGDENATITSTCGHIVDKSVDFTARQIVIDSVLTGNKARRRVIHNAKVTERGSEVLGVGGLLGYELTYTLYENAAGKRQDIYDELDTPTESYSIDWEVDGASYPGGQTSYTSLDTGITLPTPPTKTGSTFAGWLASAKSGSTISGWPTEAFTTSPTLSGASGNVVLTAQWA